MQPFNLSAVNNALLINYTDHTPIQPFDYADK